MNAIRKAFISEKSSYQPYIHLREAITSFQKLNQATQIAFDQYLVASIIQVHMKTYKDMVNEKVENLETRFTSQLNHVEDQVSELQKQQLELTKTIATLAKATAKLANRQQRFENFAFSFNRQVLE